MKSFYHIYIYIKLLSMSPTKEELQCETGYAIKKTKKKLQA